MITSKQRSALIGLANKLDTMVYVGKNGLSVSVLTQIDEILELKELIKIGVQKGAALEPKSLIHLIAEALKAEPVHTIGSKIILYRKSKNKDVQHIKF